MTRDNLIARLRKIAALAANGVGGEAANAAALLDSIAAEHGISLDDLDACSRLLAASVAAMQPGMDWRPF